MADMQDNPECKSEQHKKHLCYLMLDGFHLSNPAEYKAIVQDAQYRCQSCGRTAKSSDDLCDPVAL